MTVGGMTVIALTRFEELTGSRRARLRIALSVDAWPRMDAFLAKLGARRRWSAEFVERVRAVGEEALLLSGKHRDEAPVGGEGEGAPVGKEGEGAPAAEGARRRTEPAADRPRQGGTARSSSSSPPPTRRTSRTGWPCSASPRRAPGGAGGSPRLLRHYASSVRHYQYQDTDVVTVRVEAAGG